MLGGALGGDSWEPALGRCGNSYWSDSGQPSAGGADPWAVPTLLGAQAQACSQFRSLSSLTFRCDNSDRALNAKRVVGTML